MVSRGTWRHLGEVLLIQAYDGISFNTVPLWIRLFDLPEFMMTEDYGQSLGGKLGEVLEYGGAVRNFLRVRVDLPLNQPLKASFTTRIGGKKSVIPMKYEIVPTSVLFVALSGMHRAIVKKRNADGWSIDSVQS